MRRICSYSVFVPCILCSKLVLSTNVWYSIFLTFVIYLYTLCMASTSMGRALVSNSMTRYPRSWERVNNFLNPYVVYEALWASIFDWHSTWSYHHATNYFMLWSPSNLYHSLPNFNLLSTISKWLFEVHEMTMYCFSLKSTFFRYYSLA